MIVKIELTEEEKEEFKTIYGYCKNQNEFLFKNL
jgi:hypothetical protein